jgi:hypothetical protein
MHYTASSLSVTTKYTGRKEIKENGLNINTASVKELTKSCAISIQTTDQ